MPINRRTFIKQTSVGLLSAAVASHLMSCRSEEASDSPFKNIGIQLYTLRDLIFENPELVLKNLSKIGYKHVETFGLDINSNSFYGMSMGKFAKVLDDYGLKTYSGHYDFTKYLNKSSSEKENIEKYIEIAHELGQKYIVIPHCPMYDINALKVSDYQYFAEQMNVAGEMSKKAGIKIVYHNHYWEFMPFGNGTKGLDILIAFTESDLVDFEMDIYWTVKAGEKPQTYFDKYPNRFPLWHVKDMDRSHSNPVQFPEFDAKTGKADTLHLVEIDNNARFAEVGYGSIDYVNMIKLDQKSGLKYAFVEQDFIYSDDKIASIKKSYDYIQRALVF